MLVFYHSSKCIFNSSFASLDLFNPIPFSYFGVVLFIRWHMTPADVNAYYNSPNNYIGSLFSNSFSLEL